MFEQSFAGFSAGLSTGVYCLGSCLPIFVPLLMGDKKNIKSSFRVVIEFSLGRLLGYLVFGGIVGFLGKVINYQLVHQLVSIATIIMGILLISYSLGLLKSKKKCKIFLKKIRVPILMGFFTGINVCPPFLASLTYVFGLKSVLNSLLYFSAFFLGTSLYIVPAGFLGLFSKDTFLQKIARFGGVFVGLFFIWKGIIQLNLQFSI